MLGFNGGVIPGGNVGCCGGGVGPLGGGVTGGVTGGISSAVSAFGSDDFLSSGFGQLLTSK